MIWRLSVLEIILYVLPGIGDGEDVGSLVETRDVDGDVVFGESVDSSGGNLLEMSITSSDIIESIQMRESLDRERVWCFAKISRGRLST